MSRSRSDSSSGAEERRGLRDRQLAELVDVRVADGDGERRGPEPRAAARGARHLAHVALDQLPGTIALRVGVASLEPRDHAFERGVVRALAPVPVAVAHVHGTIAGAGQDRGACPLAEPLPRCRRAEPELVGDGFEHAVEVAAAEPGPRRDGAVGEAEIVVGDDELGVDLEARAESVAALARAVRRVEREVARARAPRTTAHSGCTRGAPRTSASRVARLASSLRDDLDLGNALGDPQRRLERVGEAPLDALAAHETIHDDFDRVLLVAGQRNLVGQLVEVAVDACPGEPLRGELLEEPVVLALSAAHDGREHLEPRALGQLEHPVDDLLRRLSGDRPVRSSGSAARRSAAYRRRR